MNPMFYASLNPGGQAADEQGTRRRGRARPVPLSSHAMSAAGDHKGRPYEQWFAGLFP